MAENQASQLVKKPIDKLKIALNADSVRSQFENCLQDNASLFVASLISIYGSNTALQRCEPKLVIQEALKAATLKLPIEPNLGFAYIVPYGGEPKFQIGYRGYIQLAQRTGQYKVLNAGIIYEGMTVERNLLTGEVKIAGEKKSDKAVGYFAYMELLNSFSKTLYYTLEEITEHAQKFSKSYDKKKRAFKEGSTWASNFDSMALKTVIRHLLSKWGIMSVEMTAALKADSSEEQEMNLQEPQKTIDEQIIEKYDMLGFAPDDESDEFRAQVAELPMLDDNTKYALLASLEKLLVEKDMKSVYGDDKVI